MSQAPAAQMLVWGRDRGRGNLLGVQPWMTSADYASASALFAKLAAYMDMATHRGWLNERTVVVWPEYIGTWLIATGEGRAVARVRSLKAAMRALALRHLPPLVPALLSASEADRVTAALFRVRADAMAAHYQALFSRLALDYGVTMVAGSTVLPEPDVVDGRVVAGRGPLHGVSAVFGRDGSAYSQLIRKAFPIGAESPFLSPGEPFQIPSFQAPAGRLGVLICADSWYPASYEALRAQEVEFVAVPSYIPTTGAWTQPWRGYDGAAAPLDVDPQDVGTLTEAQAWRRYALAGRLSQSGAGVGINVFLNGSLWDLGAEGASLMVVAGETPVAAESGRAALLNLWL